MRSPEFRYYYGVNMPINFAQKPIFSGLMFFNEPDISDSGPSVDDDEISDWILVVQTSGGRSYMKEL